MDRANFFETTYCNRTGIELYLHQNGVFTKANSDWFSFDGELDTANYLEVQDKGTYSLYFAHLSYGDTIQDYTKVDINVCGDEVLALDPTQDDPFKIILDYN